MTGLVLEGGGAKGSYEIGAYKALHEAGVNFDGVVGTSIGAINGAMIVQGDWEKAYELWYNINPAQLFDSDHATLDKIGQMIFTWGTIKQMGKNLRAFFRNQGLDTGTLEKLLRYYIDEDKIRASKLDFGFVTISISDLKPLEIFKEDIPDGKMLDYLMASANFPAFKNERRDGKFFTDGGMYNNLPVDLLVQKGYRDLYVIRIYGIGRVKHFDEGNLNIKYIKTSEPLCNTLDFRPEKARFNLELGYYDALRVLRGLKGSYYYIDNRKGEEYILKNLMKLDEDKVIKAGEILGFKGIPYRRMLFEFILPRISRVVGLSNEEGYESLIIKVFEFMARQMEFERFKVYTYREFTEKVIRGIQKLKKEPYNMELVQKELIRFITQNEILSKAMKKTIINEVFTAMF